MKKVTELARADVSESDWQKKRSVEIGYRGWKIPMMVSSRYSSVDEELDIRVKAELRGLACQTGHLTSLPAESDLCSTVVCAVTTWSLPFLKAANHRREFVRKLHTGEGKKDGESLVVQISALVSEVAPLVVYSVASFSQFCHRHRSLEFFVKLVYGTYRSVSKIPL
eukprot:6492633-Amphidinium_carterae.3